MGKLDALKSFIYFLVFILVLVAFVGSDLYNSMATGLNTLFINASSSMSGVLDPTAVIIFPLLAVTVIIALISIFKD